MEVFSTNPERTTKVAFSIMRAKKSYGQHFLTNEDIARRIANSLKTVDGGRKTVDGGRKTVDGRREQREGLPFKGQGGRREKEDGGQEQREGLPFRGQGVREGLPSGVQEGVPIAIGRWKVLEIGPGKGMLTKYLLEKDIDLKVVEADADMVEYLNGNFPLLWGNIIFHDFMKLDLATVFPSSVHLPIAIGTSTVSQFCLIGNFPYNISSQIVFKMVENRSLIPELVGMFQKEMAERIIAPPGGKDYGIISVLTQAFYSGEYLFTVGNQNFNPPPRVQSAVIRLLRNEEELGCDEALFRKVVKQAFSQRRKMMRNTLKPFFQDPSILEEDFFRLRPEVLSVADFVELTNRIAATNH